MADDIDRTDPARRSKVAVVVVHGVSDQQPFDSARSIANLLFHRYGNQSRYTTFVEQLLRIPVEALTPHRNEDLQHKGETKKHWLGCLDERGDRIRAALDLKQSNQESQQHLDTEQQTDKQIRDSIDHQVDKTIDEQIDEYSHAFTCDFLEHYNPQKSPDLSANFYDTIRLETCRTGTNRSEQSVHLYELYWADLSRLGTGFVQFFSAFYQLLFHLASLGRHTIDMATLEYSSYAKGWGFYSELHAWAGRILAVPIPLLSLYLLIAAFLTLPGNIPDRFQPWVAVSVASLIAVAAISYWLWQNFQQSLLVRMALPPLVALSVVGLQGWLGQFGYYKLLTIEWLMISIGLVWFLLIKPYAKRRLGVDCAAVALGVPLLLWALYLVSSADNHLTTGVIKASFMTIEVIYSLLVVSWFVFYGLYVLVLVLGFRLQSRLPRASTQQQAANQRAKRANWTARVSLWAPTVLFTSVTTILWAGLIFAGTSLLPKDNSQNPPIDYLHTPTPWFKGLFLTDSDQSSFSGSDFFNQLLIDPLSIIILGSLLVALVLVVWSLLPSVWAEVQPPTDPTFQAGDPRLAQQPNSTQQSIDPRFDSQLTLRFGVWLTQGGKVIYWILNFLTILLAVAISVILGYYLLGNIFKLLHFNPDLPEAIDQAIQLLGRGIQGLRGISRGIIAVLAVLLTASATSILVLGRRLDQLSLGFRNILDVILDVDNYLRQHPKEDNPRARIFARYSSLLRYLYQWTDPQDKQGYDALIIVAHSQGTVITADLLRFLKQEPPQTQKQLLPASKPDFAGIPITFFSMGSPLNQLYGAGFPHLYNWALNLNPGDGDRLKQNPKPEKLGLNRWVNTFRSGDYVGRYLWRSDTPQSQSIPPEQQLQQLFKPEVDDSQISQELGQDYVAKNRWREFCLGAGAHTHYWDANADRVVEEIDRMIDEASEHCQGSRIQ